MLKKLNYRCVLSVEEIRSYLQSARVVAFDFETAPDEPYREDAKAALDPAKAHIVGCSFSVAEGSGIYVPIDHRIGPNMDKAAFVSFLTGFLLDQTITKVAHNLAFEASMSYAKGIVIQAPVYDTMSAAQLTLKNAHEFRKLSDCGLKKLAAEFFDAPLPTFETVTGGKHFDELDASDPETIRYAAADADFALRLYHKLNAWFDSCMPKHRFLVESVESPTAVYLGVMKCNGIPVDAELMQQKAAEAEQTLARLHSEIQKYTGDIDIGAACTNRAFAKYLYETMALPVLHKTDRGQPAIDDAALTALKEWCAENKPELTELFNLVLEYRKWGKLKTTYIDGYQKYIHPVTGRIHPDMLALSTDTGRMCCRNPNAQNMPRKANDPVGVRSFIKAPKGQLILSLDFSQIELRVGAFYCRDPVMLETYRNNGDIHAATTGVIFGISPEEAQDKTSEQYKERRSIAKNINFGVFYGLFAKGLQAILKAKAGIEKTLSECEQILDNLKRGYRELSAWQARTKQLAAGRGYSETWLGRRRYLPGIQSEKWSEKSYAERCALNTPIQGTAADILKLAMARILNGLSSRPWLKPILQIHDELVFLIPEEKLDKAIQFVRACMEQQPFPEFDVPLIAEASAGVTFGALREIKSKETPILSDYEVETLSPALTHEIDETLPVLLPASPSILTADPDAAELPIIAAEITAPEDKKVTAGDVLRALFGADETVCFRVFEDRKAEKKFFGAKLSCKCCDYEKEVEEKLKEHNAQNRGISFIVNSGGHTDKEITRIKAQFFEMDDGSFEEQQKKIDAFPLPPSMIIQTKKSLHVYYFMDASAKVECFRELQLRLVQHFGGDKACVNESRAMRLPGFYHCKTEEKVEVQCICFHPERIYRQSQLTAQLPELTVHLLSSIPSAAEKGVEKVVRNCDFIQHCIEHAATLPEVDWFHLISTLAGFDGGPDLIHKYSEPYDGYTEEETQALIDYVLKQEYLPVSCSTICEKGYVCEKYLSGECKMGSPAAFAHAPDTPDELKSLILALPLSVDPLEIIQTAKTFVAEHLFNQEILIAETIIRTNLQHQLNLTPFVVNALFKAYKELHQQYLAETKKGAIPEWYSYNSKGGLTFLPGILAEHLAKEIPASILPANSISIGLASMFLLPPRRLNASCRRKCCRKVPGSVRSRTRHPSGVFGYTQQKIR